MLRVALSATVFLSFLLLLVNPALSPFVWIVGLIWVGFLFCRDLVQNGFWPSVIFCLCNPIVLASSAITADRC
jgi:hypothetical protein